MTEVTVSSFFHQNTVTYSIYYLLLIIYYILTTLKKETLYL